MKRTALLLLFFLASVVAFNAQNVEHPDKGSAGRTALLETLRVPVERELKQKIVFVVHTINVVGSWAFVDARLRTPAGNRPVWKITRYAKDAKYGIQSDGVSALYRRSGRRWRITTYAIGCTDVCYAGWWKQYKAPKAVFPYTE